MKIEWLIPAIHDLQRLREFILPHNKVAAQRAARIIKGTVTFLESNPLIGKPVEDLIDYRDIIIPFGSSGHVLRYRFRQDTIFIVSLKHRKEAGFPDQE